METLSCKVQNVKKPTKKCENMWFSFKIMKIKDENFQKITSIKSKFAYLTNYLITLCFIERCIKNKKSR